MHEFTLHVLLITWDMVSQNHFDETGALFTELIGQSLQNRQTCFEPSRYLSRVFRYLGIIAHWDKTENNVTILIPKLFLDKVLAIAAT